MADDEGKSEAPEQAPVDAPQQPSSDVPEQADADVPAQAPADPPEATEQTSSAAPEQANAPEEAVADAQEATPAEATEEVATEQAPADAPEEVTTNAPQEESVDAPEQVPAEASDQATTDAPEQATVDAPEQAVTDVPEQASGPDAAESATAAPASSPQPDSAAVPESAPTTTPAPDTTTTPAPAPPPTAEKRPQTDPPMADVPPPPALMGKAESMDESEEMSARALNMVWSFGMNRHVPVLNLTDGNRRIIMYVCAHTAVLYDIDHNTQQLLMGHSNAITCTCASEDKRWIATADRGPDSLVIVWDSHSGIPVRTIFDAHPDGGVVAMAMTPDAMYLATMSAAETQTLAIWDWTVEGETPMCTAELKKKYGMQHYIYFNPEDTSQIVTNSESQVIFYSWKNGEINYFAPPLTDDDFNKQVGKYSQSIFMSHSTRALTATSVGNLVVWDTNKPLTKVVSNLPTPDKKALKLVKLQEKGINVLTVTDRFIVAGDVLGHVKFFDQTLKLMNWYQDFHLGPVNALSFKYVPEIQARIDSAYPPDATIAARQFAVRDFVVGTTTAVYAHVTTDGTDVTVIHRDHDAAVHALAPHPKKPWLAVGSYSGLLKIWDYERKEVIMSRVFERGMIRCCVYDSNGESMAVGFTNGTIRVVDSLSLKDNLSEPFHYSRDAVTHLAFSHDSRYLASSDAEYTVSLFAHEKTSWLYMGRYRAHYKPIKDLCFGIQLDSEHPRLMSLGEDRLLVEYDLEESGPDDLRVHSSERVEQSAVPLCMTWYPPITKESFILTANDQFKFKMYNSTTKMCRKTLLGPTYGTPVERIAVVPTADEISDKRYMAFATYDKVGLHILPLDGNPHNAQALSAHPGGVANLVCSYDGKHVFTAGGGDGTVHMWTINKKAIEAQSEIGGPDLIPFYGLLDGGREGELFRELEDYFYYAQLRSQGINTMESRKASVKIDLSEVPFVMRSLGFYPSEQEVEDMLNEVKYSTYVETGQYTTDIDLGDFIKLYINHRPAFGLQLDKIKWAFEVLGMPGKNEHSIERGELLHLLQSTGEPLTEYELAEYLTCLLGFNDEGGSSELQEFDPSMTADIIDEHLPHEVTADMFSNELLGFNMYADVLQLDNLSEADNMKSTPLESPTARTA